MTQDADEQFWLVRNLKQRNCVHLVLVGKKGHLDTLLHDLQLLLSYIAGLRTGGGRNVVRRLLAQSDIWCNSPSQWVNLWIPDSNRALVHEVLN